jgi:hypothetical protein
MFKFEVSAISILVSTLQLTADDAMRVHQFGKPTYDNTEMKEAAATSLEAGIKVFSEMANVESSLVAQMGSLRDHLRNERMLCSPAFLNGTVQQIITGIHALLGQRMFTYVPSEDAPYWNNFQMFGAKFLTTFPIDTVFEVMEAYNCLVASRYTASVFHAMRVAEYGLRKLARLVGGVKLIDKGKLIPIEYADWDKVIQGIKNRITAVRQLPRGPKKEKRLQFYSSAADQCEYMKDIWRNQTAHTRPRRYKREESLGVINRVREFSQLLAERECTPKKHADLVERKLKEVEEWFNENGEEARETKA